MDCRIPMKPAFSQLSRRRHRAALPEAASRRSPGGGIAPLSRVLLGRAGDQNRPDLKAAGPRGPAQTAPHIKARVSGPDSGQKYAASLLKRLNSPYRPALPEDDRATMVPRLPTGLLGRSQAVRQRILIPPFGGSIPPAPASHSGIRPGFPRDARMGRKSGLFAHSILSPDSQLADLGAPNRRKSPATTANIPVLRRLSAETWCDHDCRPPAAVKFG